jgi:hypothetical protein
MQGIRANPPAHVAGVQLLSCCSLHVRVSKREQMQMTWWSWCV